MEFSTDCMKEELDFFGEPISQTEVEDSRFIEYLPIQSIDANNDIRFRLIGGGDEYLDLQSSFIVVNLEIMRANEAAIPANEKIFPVNNLLHSIFNKVNVTFNNTLVATDHANYACRAYLQTLLNFDKNDQEGILSAALWIKDDPNKFNSVLITDAARNHGAKKRKSMFNMESNYGSIQLAGRLFVDLFHQDKLIPNNIDIDIELHKNTPHYPFITDGIATKFTIKNIRFYARKVLLNKDMQSIIEKKFSNEPAVFPFVRSILKTLPIVENSSSVHHENLFLGRMPSRIFLGFMETASYSKSNYKRNPFHLEHFNINYIAIYKNDKMIPSKAYTPNFTNGDYVRSYLSVFHATNTYYNNKSVNISLSEYSKGYTLWGFDLSPDQCKEDFFQKPETGNIKLEVRFTNPLRNNVTCLVYADFNDILEIDKNREITLKYTI